MKILKIILNPLLEQTPDSHFVLRLFDKGENDLLNNKTIDSVPPMSPPVGCAGRVAQISKNYCSGKELKHNSKLFIFVTTQSNGKANSLKFKLRSAAAGEQSPPKVKKLYI